MSGSVQAHAERRSARTLAPTIALAGIGAVLAVAAAVPAAATGSHQASSAHHAADRHSSRHHERRLLVRGLVAGHHGRTMTVFARTAQVGARTRHDERIRIVFARSAHGRTRIPTGDHLRLSATGIAHKHVFWVRHDHDEMVTTARATLFFGTVTAVDGHLLTVAENDRDDGDHHDGEDNDGHRHRHGDNDEVSPADHSPGGPGDGDHDGNDDGHRITIDDTSAAVTVDGMSGSITVGDSVAVLGEAANNTVVASTIYAFTTPPSFRRGKVQQVAGDNVTFRKDGDSTTVSLAGVPLALNGDVGATPNQLMTGDKLLLIGPLDADTGQVVPDVAFAFNHHDDHPCGDNDDGAMQ
jgi:uncharacterized Zn-binding protein involved in type VI secretion